jgi:hypothetical protein
MTGDYSHISAFVKQVSQSWPLHLLLCVLSSRIWLHGDHEIWTAIEKTAADEARRAGKAACRAL